MAKDKVRAVMGEYKRGALHSGSGAKVKSRKQAIAIALSEARKAGANIPEPSEDRETARRVKQRYNKRRK